MSRPSSCRTRSASARNRWVGEREIKRGVVEVGYRRVKAGHRVLASLVRALRAPQTQLYQLRAQTVTDCYLRVCAPTEAAPLLLRPRASCCGADSVKMPAYWSVRIAAGSPHPPTTARRQTAPPHSLRLTHCAVALHRASRHPVGLCGRTARAAKSAHRRASTPSPPTPPLRSTTAPHGSPVR